MITTKKPKIKQSEIGLFLRIVQMDYSPSSMEETALLIEEHFDVKCTVEDIQRYEQLYYEQEDYEKLSRMMEFGNLEQFIE
jgi:hypothetical protein